MISYNPLYVKAVMAERELQMRHNALVREARQARAEDRKSASKPARMVRPIGRRLRLVPGRAR